MRRVRIAPSGDYVDWAEEFAGTGMGVISRVGQAQGPAAPINLLASQAAGQEILSLAFSLTLPQYNRIQAAEYLLGYVCLAEFEVQDVSVNEGTGGALLSEFMVEPAGGAVGRRITKPHRPWSDVEGTPAIMVTGVLMAYLSPAMVAGWVVGDNTVHFGLSCPGTATAVVPANRSRLTVAEVVGDPGYTGP